MKTWLVKITVVNSGCNFEDDVDFVYITTEDTSCREDVYRKLDEIDHLLRKEDEDDCHCVYDDIGYNTCAFMDEVCRYTGWNWEFCAPDISFEIR